MALFNTSSKIVVPMAMELDQLNVEQTLVRTFSVDFSTSDQGMNGNHVSRELRVLCVG